MYQREKGHTGTMPPFLRLCNCLRVLIYFTQYIVISLGLYLLTWIDFDPMINTTLGEKFKQMAGRNATK